jgi:hypothetical protein
MGFGRTIAAGLVAGLCLADPAVAQPSEAVPAAKSAPIVVTAPPRLAPGEKPSAWKRAEAEHVVVYSDGSADQLQRVTANLEKLHALLARLYLSRGHGQEPAPLEVVLFDSAGDMRDLGLRNPRADVPADEGPFAKPFALQRYYDPRPDGSVLALPRIDQVVALDTDKAHIADCLDASQAGGDCMAQFPPPYHPPTSRSWEALLYGAYAQHLVVNYAPAAYPRWYFDGIGALFSTVVFKRDGSVEYGRPPDDYRLVFRSYGLLNTESVLTGRYLHEPSVRMDWTPYHAWLLTHFFVLSKLGAKERAQFEQYMSAIAHGRSMAEAAQAFGPMTRLGRQVLSYAGRSKEFAATAKSAAEPPVPVTPLSEATARALLAGLASHPS